MKPHLLLCVASVLAAQNPRDTVVASATQDKTPRAGIVLSSFSGSEDHDGTKVPGLARPVPLTAALTAAQVQAMVDKALDIGEPRAGGIETIISPEDWVAVLCGEGASPEVAGAVVRRLIKAGRGGRFTLLGCGPAALAAAGAAAGKARVEARDWAGEQAVEAPIPQGERTYAVARTLQECDRVVAVAALAGDLIFGAYMAAAPKAPRTPLAMTDVFSYHPADYALLASSHTVIAGANAVAVDALGMAILGRDPMKTAHLERAVQMGFGVHDPDLVWTRGNTIEEVQKALGGKRR